jgi:hypothetical protein
MVSKRFTELKLEAIKQVTEWYFPIAEGQQGSVFRRIAFRYSQPEQVRMAVDDSESYDQTESPRLNNKLSLHWCNMHH